MSADQAAQPGGQWDEAAIEALLAPAVRALAQPTSLSPLPYDLNAGVPDRASLPARELAEAAVAALAEDPAGALTYGGQQGFEPLRAWIAERQSAETGLALTPAHVSLTAGSAHGIDTVAATFLSPGDVAIVGAPSYPGAIRTFRARGARVVDVPQDEDGLRPEPLRKALEQQRAVGAPAKLIYLVPNYDNPSGATLPLERREAIVRVAAEHRALVVEDDAYTGIDLDGPPPPPLFQVAEGQGVIRLGTFSKTIATGLRVGWTLAAPAITERLVFMRFDNGASPFLHRMLLHYLRSGAYEPHVKVLQDIYRARRDASAAALVEHAEPYITFRKPAGGFFHWLRLREGLDAARVAATAAEEGVAVTPGTMYYADGGGEGFVRLVYSALPPEDLREAITRFGRALERVAREGEG
ncbi:MAG: aminotransferase class I/II-fold pyridoxal phosphate-dependent enzyme [Dehalococcoidia bacterium]|nr:aminotransferase class I/II-fold pyridoxal phosphate-dependent enzyme [Dehalococcoidia bacterium]